MKTPSPIRIRSILSASARLCVFLSVNLVCSPLTADAEPPNIILLMGDDHGWEEVGYHGHAQLKTPVLDEMAASGLKLEHFYSGHPSCSPTRGSVLTGRHPNRYGTFSPGCSIRPEENHDRSSAEETGISLRALRQMAPRTGQEKLSHQSRQDGFRQMGLAR